MGGRGEGYPAPERSSGTQAGSSYQCPGLTEEADLSWRLPSGTGPQTLPSRPRGRSQVPRTQLALRLLRPPKRWGAGPPDCVPCRLSLPLGHRGRAGGEGHRCLRAWARPVGGPGQGSGALQDTPPACSLGPSAHLPGRGRGAGGPRVEDQDLPLTSTPQLTTTTPPTFGSVPL